MYRFFRLWTKYALSMLPVTAVADVLLIYDCRSAFEPHGTGGAIPTSEMMRSSSLSKFAFATRMAACHSTSARW